MRTNTYAPHFPKLIVFGILLAICNNLGARDTGANEIEEDSNSIIRGGYIARTSNCISCHTDVKDGSPLLGGGRPIITKFGTFFSPNITADPINGIGQWTLEDFRNALTQGYLHKENIIILYSHTHRLVPCPQPIQRIYGDI